MEKEKRGASRRMSPSQAIVIFAIIVSIIIFVAIELDNASDRANGTMEMTATYVASQPENQNDAWTPIIEVFEGVEMVLVPAGCFQMGSDRGDKDELPIHAQCIEADFWIDRYEVTNAQYGSLGCVIYSSQPKEPRNCVTWLDAMAHCQARGGSLPTEVQWEYAARGPDNLFYPWGNDFVSDYLAWGGASDWQLETVGRYPEGASWVGAQDMSGSLWEWVSTIYRDYPYDATDGREDPQVRDASRTLRGGSYLDDDQQNQRAADRGYEDPMNAAGFRGFRCARPVD